MSYFSKLQLNDQYGFVTECTPMDELRTVNPVRLAGSTFIGTTLDPNFWTSTIAASGGTIATAVVGSGKLLISSQTDATGSVIVQSVRRGRYIGGSSNRYRAQIQLSDTGLANNTKRWGMFDGNDGAYFKLLGTALSVNTMKNTTETSIASASWNNSTGTPTLTNCNTYEIYVTNRKIYFSINSVLVHTEDTNTRAGAANDTWTNTITLPVRQDNINSGNTTNTTMSIRVATIYRLGQLQTNTQYGRITTAATYNFKYGAGVFHKITLNNPGGTLITIYDDTTGTANTLAIINSPAQANPVTLWYNIPFQNGLKVVTTGTWDATVIYE